MTSQFARRDLMKGAVCASALTYAATPAAAAPAAVRMGKAVPGDGVATISERIASFVAKARFEDLPPDVIEKAKAQIVFFIGRAFEGCRSEAARQINAIAPILGRPQNGGATAIGQTYQLSPSDAAFVNCSLMRGDLGYDDVLWPAGIHAGVVTLPPALALGEMRQVSGRDLILALALGYEVMGKLGRAANGWETAQPRRPTNIYGAFGPAAVAGKLLKLSERQLTHLMGYAVNTSIGIPEGGMMQHYYSFIARSGVTAAELVAAGGVSYSRTTIEGDLGLYRSFFGEKPAGLEALIGSMGQDWELLRAEQKRFVGTGANAVAIAQLSEVMRTERLAVADVEKVEVVLPFGRRASARKDAIAGKGPFTRQVDAYSSLPYAIALTLLFNGKVGAHWYAPDTPLAKINDPRLLPLMLRTDIQFEARDDLRYSRLTVTSRDGRRFSRETTGFEVPFPRREWGSWLRGPGAPIVGSRSVKALEAGIAKLETTDNIAPLMRHLA